MEKLNSLGSSLPPERSPTDQVIESLNGELSQEFKIAANAVTKLYRVANERNSLLKHGGYLQCVEDLLDMLEREPGLSVEDIHLWCLKQKGEILSHQNPGNEVKSTGSKYNFDFSGGGDTKNSDSSKVPTFRLSTPPLSVEYPKPKKTIWSVQKQETWNSVPCNHQQGNSNGDAADEMQEAEPVGSGRADTLAAPSKKQKVISTIVTPSRRKARNIEK